MCVLRWGVELPWSSLVGRSRFVARFGASVSKVPHRTKGVAPPGRSSEQSGM